MCIKNLVSQEAFTMPLKLKVGKPALSFSFKEALYAMNEAVAYCKDIKIYNFQLKKNSCFLFDKFGKDFFKIL